MEWESYRNSVYEACKHIPPPGQVFGRKGGRKDRRKGRDGWREEEEIYGKETEGGR